MNINPLREFASVTDFLMQRRDKTHIPGKSEVVVDKATNVEYPGEACELKGGRCGKLFGVGTRRLSIIGYPVNVYSVGMYIPANFFKGHMRKYSGKPAKALSSDSSFLSDMKDIKLEKEIRFVTVFKKVTKDKFWKALQTRIAPLISQAQRDKELVSFKSHFDDVTFKKGMDVRLALSSDGSVTTVIDGAKKGTVKSEPLSKALVDVYLGNEPPSPALKSDFLATAAALLEK